MFLLGSWAPVGASARAMDGRAALWSGGQTNCSASASRCQRGRRCATHHRRAVAGPPGAWPPGGAAKRQCFGMAGGVVSALTGAFTSCVDFLPSLSANVSVTATVSPSLSGCVRSISITW